jgi:serine protease Do
VREKYGLDGAQSGVVINEVAAGTDAAARGLSQGDVILQVQGDQVQTPQQVHAAIEVARTQRRPYVAVLVLRKAQDIPGPVWTALRISPP